MIINARRATATDRDGLVEMYGRLAEEQQAIRPIWPHTDGLAQPVDDSIGRLIDSEDALVIVGQIDGSSFGFLVAIEAPLLAPREAQRIGVIKFIYTEPEARGVGVGSAMLAAALDNLIERGIALFDAPVSPGHRMAKNFFEANGFKARSITMHRSDRDGEEAPER